MQMLDAEIATKARLVGMELCVHNKTQALTRFQIDDLGKYLVGQG